MQTKQKDTYDIQPHAEENQNKENSTLIKRENIQNTPFTAIEVNEEWFIVMGKHRVTEKYKTKEEAIERLEIEKWFIIMTLASIIAETIKKEPNSLLEEMDQD